VAAAVLELERRLGVSPASLAFGLRVLTEPAVRAAVADLGRRTGRLPERPARALDFEKERALRMLGDPQLTPLAGAGPASRTGCHGRAGRASSGAPHG